MGPGFYLNQAAGRLDWHLDTQVKRRDGSGRVQAFVYSVDPANAEASAGAIHLDGSISAIHRPRLSPPGDPELSLHSEVLTLGGLT